MVDKLKMGWDEKGGFLEPYHLCRLINCMMRRMKLYDMH
jgi:hypothetical protein